MSACKNGFRNRQSVKVLNRGSLQADFWPAMFTMLHFPGRPLRDAEAPRGVYPKKRPCLASGLYSDDTTSTQAAPLSESSPRQTRESRPCTQPPPRCVSRCQFAVELVLWNRSSLLIRDLFGGTPLRSLCCISQHGRYKRCIPISRYSLPRSVKLFAQEEGLYRRQCRQEMLPAPRLRRCSCN